MIFNKIEKKGNLFLFGFILSLFFIFLVSAQSPFQQVSGELEGLDLRFPPVEAIKIGRNVTSHMHVYNHTNGLLLTNTTVDCFVHLYNSVGNHLVEQEMGFDDNSVDFELLILGGNFTISEMQSFIIWCNSTTAGGFVSGAFDVTPTGFTNLLGFYIIIISISLIFLILGFWIKDPWIVIFGTFGLFFVGLYILLNGIDGIRNLAYTRAIAFIIIGLAAYISIKAGISVGND